MQKSVKGQLASGVFYTALSKYAGIGVSLLVSAVLARLISPDDFGVIAIATVLITFFNIFSDFGIGPAIVQNTTLEKRDLSNIFSFTVFLGLFMGLVFFGLSWGIAWYYEKEVLIRVCQVLSINLFFASINIVPNGLLLKAKKFKFIAYRTLGLQLIGGIISVIAALKGLGIYSLLINPILTSVGLFFINYYRYPQRFRWNVELLSLKKIASFSMYQFLFNFINYFSRNLDKLLIGKFMNMSLLGYYEKSYRLMTLPLQNITSVVTPVMHPIFAEYQTDIPRISSYYLKIVRLLAFVGFPLSALLYFTARESILIVFGNQWIESIPIFEILSFSVGIQIILSTSGSIFQATNTTKSLFLTGVLSAIMNVSGLLIGLFVFKSLTAIAWAFVVTFTFNFFQCYWIMYKKVFKEKLSDFLKILISPLIVTAIISVALYFVSSLIQDCHIVISLIIKSAIFGIILLSYIQIVKEYDLFKLVKKYIYK